MRTARRAGDQDRSGAAAETQRLKTTMNSVQPWARISSACGHVPVQPIVFVVDNDAAVRESLQLLATLAGWRAEAFATAGSFLDRPPVPVPSCLVLDVSLPDANGLELQARLAMERPDLPVIFITEREDVSLTVRAMKAGALDFLTKPANHEMLTSAIREALERSRVSLEQDARLRDLRARQASLTPRERDVMPLVVAGRMNKQVGAELGITEFTVKVHRRGVMAKMKARSLPDLVKMSAALGLIADW
jgi:FixJ family two-component response regulator